MGVSNKNSEVILGSATAREPAEDDLTRTSGHNQEKEKSARWRLRTGGSAFPCAGVDRGQQAGDEGKAALTTRSSAAETKWTFCELVFQINLRLGSFTVFSPVTASKVFLFWSQSM